MADYETMMLKGVAIMGKERISDYVLMHLGDVAAKTSEITGDIQELLTHPDRNTGIEPRLETARKLVRDNLVYLSQGLSDLRAFEAGSGAL